MATRRQEKRRLPEEAERGLRPGQGEDSGDRWEGTWSEVWTAPGGGRKQQEARGQDDGGWLEVETWK